MPRSARRDIFACGKSDIAPAVQWYYIRRKARGSNITAEGNITRRKANITEKALAAQVLFQYEGLHKQSRIKTRARAQK